MEYLDKAVLLLSCIIEVYILFDFFDNFFERREAFKKYGKVVFLSLIIAGSLFGLNLMVNAYANLFGALILFWIYASLLFSAGIGNRLVYYIILFSIFLGCEFLFVVLLEIPSYFLEQTSIISLSEIPWQVLAMKLLTYILVVIIKQFSNKSRNRMDNKIFIMYLCVPIASLCIMLLTYYSSIDFSERPLMKVIMSACFALMLLGNILIFYAFNRYSEEMSLSMRQELIIIRQDADLSYYNQIQEINEKYKEFIHNTSHYLKTIGELARKNENASILDILRELHVELENNTMNIYSENHVMNAILNEKESQANKVGVLFDIYVEPGALADIVSDADLITMLGNLLDNAIVAAQQGEKEHYVRTRIFMQNEGGFCVVKITNNFAGEIIRSKGGFVSTKKEKEIHGIGIQSVQNTAGKYNGYLECFVEGDIFTAILVLPIK
ncbi:GHKL domain-containing protein [Kineothrix alysoides]|uniref:GHKL domain-containing protein n=1 Tax=Kineothrix alysoides TaxID=1469948 RepID=A0A4R1QW62_9FIRM|nr:GHKL domain-containing protein [Kineothrix alysoides]TCL57603.1 GHKL domain-containing protein [Kineothrix alysoides]